MVTAPLFLMPPGSLQQVAAGSPLELAGDEGRHAAGVRRIRPGEPIEVADGEGRRARCWVVAAGRSSLTLRVLAVLDEPAAAVRLVLVQALAKGGRDEQAVEAATELGVDAVIPWQAERSVPVWAGERRAKGRDRWQAAVREAAKQSRRARVPQVAELVDGTSLAAAVRQAALALVLDGSAEQPIPPDGLPTAGDVLLVVGPEGGISEPELAALTGAGALPVRLGPHVLRTSTAGPAALALLCRQLRW
jgi:16S rRNA (uracil1498-N3)-methyltransferase